MRKFLFLLLALLFLTYISEGQQQYFNRRYDISHAENGFNILPYDSGYIMWLSTINGNLKVVEYFLDSYGNEYLSKVYGSTQLNIFHYINGTGKICRTNDSGYAFGGASRSAQSESNVLLYRFDHLGDTVFVKEYGDTLWQAGSQCKQTRDGGFIITGETLSYNSWGDIFLIKTDSNGIVEWQNHYGGLDKERAYSVDTCIDGGFIVAGFTMSYGTNAYTDCANAYLVKTDSLGNFQWQKTLGGYFFDSFEQVLQSSDGYIYAFGYYSFSDNASHCIGGMNKSYVLKIDNGGNILWEKFYGDSVYGTMINNAEELPNGDFILGGMTTDTNLMYNGLLIKINSQGDSLMYKTYKGVIGNYSLSFFYDVTLDKDNGFICTGYVVPTPPDTGNQDVWVLKLDSNGCEISNCLLSEIISWQAPLSSFILYPNPVTANSEITFTYSTLSEPGEISIFNVDGKKVAANTLPQWSSLQKMKLPELAGGVYLARLQSGSKVVNLKFVLQ